MHSSLKVYYSRGQFEVLPRSMSMIKYPHLIENDVSVLEMNQTGVAYIDRRVFNLYSEEPYLKFPPEQNQQSLHFRDEFQSEM